jgi:diguanylate cyclase (GGDEF)-like protein
MQLQLQRCAVMGSGAAVLLLDIDHFKQINDRHGHAVGDQLLQTLAQQLLRNCRAGDTACRYGGDEFLLLLTEVTPDAALARAQQLRQDFAVQQLRVEDQYLSTTLSCGLALFPAHGTEPARLIQRADQALYQAKLHGRNAVVVFEHHLETCTDGAK